MRLRIIEYINTVYQRTGKSSKCSAIHTISDQTQELSFQGGNCLVQGYVKQRIRKKLQKVITKPKKTFKKVNTNVHVTYIVINFILEKYEFVSYMLKFQLLVLVFGDSSVSSYEFKFEWGEVEEWVILQKCCGLFLLLNPLSLKCLQFLQSSQHTKNDCGTDVKNIEFDQKKMLTPTKRAVKLNNRII